MLEKDLANLVSPVVEAVVAVEKNLNDLQARVEAIKVVDGKDGQDADAAAVAKALQSDTDFIEKLRGESGIGIKAVEMSSDCKTMTLVMDNDQTVDVELPSGPRGAEGAAGRDGLGLETKAWAPSVYREGSFVTYGIGKIYKALRDTADKPSSSDDWQRVGSAGFEWTGLKSDRAYENGDLFIDGGSTFIWWDGKGHMFTQRGARGPQGEKGLDGRNGSDAATIVAVKYTTKGAYIAMSDGSVLESEIDGLHDVVKEITQGAVLTWIDAVYQQIEDEGGTPIRSFRGEYRLSDSYSRGDVVNFNKSVWVAKESTSANYFDDQVWRRMFSMGAGGGGGGGGGGITTTTKVLADGSLNMGNFNIVNVLDPRTGPTGSLDAVNKQSMQAAIAAGSLYQGTYKPATGGPNIPFLANTAFTAPVGNTVISSPNVAAPAINSPLDILVWFNMKGKGLDNFAAVLAAPLLFDVTFSNGTHKTYLLPAGNYADATAVQTALNALTGTEAKFLTYVNGADFWVGVETPPQAYATSIVGQAGGGFPDYTTGPTSTVLNTYNWVVSTTDPNVPEYAPPGLPGIPAGTKLNNSDLLQFNAALKQFEIIRGGNLTQSFADQRYWQLNAGNMKWSDQPYASGAVVYGTRFNAWFVANQNIVAGSPEPGTTAAGGLWRKINSTYGSTIFFGKGDYNPADTTAAANWGMPAGTYPSGQQPLNGDSYYDVTSGTEVQFAVTQNAPIYTLSGVIGKTGSGGSRIGAVLGNADLGAGWPAARPAPANLADWYEVTLGAPQTPTTGVFAGQTIAAGSYLLGFSGDPDATNGGWFLVAGAPSATGVAWTINTPHPQARPDTVTPTVIWGYRRNFEFTVQSTVPPDGSRILLLSNIPNTTGITHIEVRNRRGAGNGAVYEFEVITETGVATLLSPIAIQSVGSQFSDIQVAYVDATLGVCVWGIVKNATGGGISNIDSEKYSIIATTYDYDLGVLRTGNGIVWANTTAAADTIKGQENYPSPDLRRLIRSQSGDPAASLPPDTTLGVADIAPQLATTAGLRSVWSIYGNFAGKSGNQLKFWESRFYKGAGGDAVNMSLADFVEMSSTKVDKTTGAVENKTWVGLLTHAGRGYINFLNTDYPIEAGSKAFVEFVFDTRDPNIAIYNLIVRYRTTGGHYVKNQATFTLAAGNFTQRISFYAWDGAAGSSNIPAIAFKA